MRRRSPGTWPWALLLVVTATGCSDRGHWARWQAEQALWKADRARSRAGQGSAESRALEPLYTNIVHELPASAWVARAQSPGLGRDVATVAARAQWRLALLAAARGEHALAASRAEQLVRDWQTVPALAALGSDRLAEARIRLGDEAGAQAALEQIVATAPLLTDDHRALVRVVAEAPFALARIARARGDEPAAQAALLRAEARAIEATPHTDSHTRELLELHRLRCRAARGDAAGALARAADLARAAHPEDRLARMLDVADAALELGQLDSALAHAREAEPAPSRRTGGRAMLIAARALLGLGQPDSALAVLERLSERWYDIGALSPDSRSLRGEALAALGREETARAERRALIAGYPTHPLAFLALERIVTHHIDAGQTELARLEGEQALNILERTLANHRDPGVQREVLLTRARLLARLGATSSADSTALELFERFPDDSASQAGLLDALDRWPPEAQADAALWRGRIASRSMAPEVRARARRGPIAGE